MEWQTGAGVSGAGADGVGPERGPVSWEWSTKAELLGLTAAIGVSFVAIESSTLSVDGQVGSSLLIL
jgi:hypothetical protein